MVKYTCPDSEVTITANIGHTGMAVLSRLGWTADYELEARNRRASKRAKLDEFLARKKMQAQNEALDAITSPFNGTVRREIVA